MLDVVDPHEVERFAAQGSFAIVTVREAKGSTPRTAGTQMLVSEITCLGSIGGGQLEYLAIDEARALLKNNAAERTLSVPLGPEIGQCCGGHVTIHIARDDEAKVSEILTRMHETKNNQPGVTVFGAGHVGRALAVALKPLPVNTLLVDTREEELSLADPDIRKDFTALPEAHVRAAKAGSAFVILTHDHALDFLITKEALERGDAAYIGMIGSKTKRAAFASWLTKEGSDGGLMKQLTMPIGVSNLADKRPAVIAAMVAAEVMEAVGSYAAAEVPA
ncbi:MAG: xanthine dehydrogenase accessory protein XdhC [Pseudomonadota bacterium]